MAREFTRNMFIMLVSIMVGVIVITFFVGDIMNRSKMDTLTEQHNVEISDINSRNENFTNYYLQGAVKMDSAREVREVANYYFDFALFWFNNALANQSKNLTKQCIDNCTNAMQKYLGSHENFGKSKPYFINARNYTNNSRYLEVLGYYIGFAGAGQNITMLRYNASDYLRRAAENLSFGNMENVTLLMENFTVIEQAYEEAQQQYQEYRYQIDGYIFFSTIREIPDQ
ncbi:MAG: hypothetical protein IMZ53_16645 [Thermoplasmata archaeon]|nr:hypothetical protein [Thermoplasmata archaeon]MBE3142202.1 hypothetical protein [Thermoplasmata archaeon]